MIGPFEGAWPAQADLPGVMRVPMRLLGRCATWPVPLW